MIDTIIDLIQMKFAIFTLFMIRSVFLCKKFCQMINIIWIRFVDVKRILDNVCCFENVTKESVNKSFKDVLMTKTFVL